MKERQGLEKGFIGTIILVIIALALLKYFLDWSVFEAAESPEGQETIGYTRSLINLVWSYIGPPLVFIWERIFWPILSLSWNNFQKFIEWGQENGSRF